MVVPLTMVTPGVDVVSVADASGALRAAFLYGLFSVSPSLTGSPGSMTPLLLPRLSSIVVEAMARLGIAFEARMLM